ncbi:MAG: nicotinate phosphoribosyltransferase [Phycisphaerales bacterium]|nr:MAG: nicotinate phosphoribosyltransferase [Phycisphaerales bacterium]
MQEAADMWLIDATPALFTDLYELTMAQVYFKKHMDQTAEFEVTVRRLPEHWGYFVMAGLAEIETYLEAFRFDENDVAYLQSLGTFETDFLDYLGQFKPRVRIRALPEGTVFFPHEPILEVSGPILDAQLLETYILNILGFSIIEATLAARTVLAAGDKPVLDFGLRRCQGPISALRAARGGQIAGFKATSNVFAGRALTLLPSGTMAHSYVQAHDGEEQAFRDFAEQFGQNAVLLVDTYDTLEGIQVAAAVAQEILEAKGIRIKGIRIDSGDLVALSRFAREYFDKQGLDFLRIFVSGDLDEYKIRDLLEAGAEIDGIGIGTRYSTGRHAPALEIVYKIVQYHGRNLCKSSPDKVTRPGRKTITRVTDSGRHENDIIGPFDPAAPDLLRPFEAAEPMETIQRRLAQELAALPGPFKAIRDPETYPVHFTGSR